MNCAWYFIADKAIAVWKNTAVATAVLGNLGVKVTFSMSCTFMSVKWQATVSELQNVVFHWASDGAKHLSVPALLGHSHCILHNSPWKKSCDSTRLSRQSTVGLRNPKPQTSPLQPALLVLKRLKWQHKRGAPVPAVTPSSLGFVLSISDMECPAGPHRGWLFPALFLWWAPCPESFYSSPWLSLPLFSDFRIPQCLYCAAHLPWPWLWCCAQMHHQAWLCVAFLLPAVCLKTPFFSPFPVFLSLLCSLQCLSDHFTRVASVISHFKTCEDLFTPFLPSEIFQQTQQRNWHHHSLDFLCHLSPEKQQHVQGWGQQQLSGELWPTQAAALGTVCSPQWILSFCDHARSCCLIWQRLSESQMRHGC